MTPPPAHPLGRRRTLALPLLPLVAGGARGARAQAAAPDGAGSWPDRPVRVVVPYPPGGSTDILTRVLAESLRATLGQPFVVENRPGAGGNIGIEAVVRSAPDGHTVGMATVGHFAINQHLYARVGWDPERDLAPASLTWDLPNVAVVAAAHNPARTLAEFAAWARARPQGYTFGSPGIGTSPHLSAELLRARLGLSATHVPFRGAAQTIPAMLSGSVDFALDNLSSYLGAIQEGRMRALAVTSAARWPGLPGVPTMAEAGLDDFVVTSWAAWVFPAGTPRPVVGRLAAAQRRAADDSQVRERFRLAGAEILASPPEEVAARGARESPLWRDVVRRSGARAD